MMRRAGGFLLVTLGVALMVVQGVEASEQRGDRFDALVKALSVRYAVQPKSVPMMWMVNLCARGVTHGGVRGMKVVEFERSALSESDRAGFDDVVSGSFGEDWSRMVREWQESGDESLVYVRAAGRGVEMVVIDLDHGELDLVKMTMNPDQFAKWTREKNSHAMIQ